MNLEALSERQAEIEAAITNTSSHLNALHGHKAETEHWIQKLKAQVPVSDEDNATLIECQSEHMV